MPGQRHHAKVRCLHVVRFSILELRNAIGRVIEHPSTEDYLDGLSYMPGDPIPYTGRAQSIDIEGRVIAEGFFCEGRPEGPWTRWYSNGNVREQFHIEGGECRYARHWDSDGEPL